MHRSIYYLFFLLAVFWLRPATAQDIQDYGASMIAFEKGKKEFAAKNYKEAQKDLTVAAKQGSRNGTIQYYLALAAAQNGDYATFKRALARIVVSNNTKTGLGQRALQMLQTNVGATCKPYTVLNNSLSVSRFVKADMPIKIYISQGLMLPPAFRGKAPERTQMAPLIALLNNPATYATLQRDPNFNSSLYGCVTRGLAKWDWARTEGILDYRLVTNPNDADVLVFWCPMFQIQETCGYTANMAVNKKYKVVMQFVTKGIIPPNILNEMVELNAIHGESPGRRHRNCAAPEYYRKRQAYITGAL